MADVAFKYELLDLFWIKDFNFYNFIYLLLMKQKKTIDNFIKLNS